MRSTKRSERRAKGWDSSLFVMCCMGSERKPQSKRSTAAKVDCRLGLIDRPRRFQGIPPITVEVLKGASCRGRASFIGTLLQWYDLLCHRIVLLQFCAVLLPVAVLHGARCNAIFGVA